MKYETIVSISNTTPIEDKGAIVKNLFLTYRKRHLRIGRLLINPIVDVGLSGEDFTRNRNSYRISFDCYRIPRFLKNHLLKKK